MDFVDPEEADSKLFRNVDADKVARPTKLMLEPKISQVGHLFKWQLNVLHSKYRNNAFTPFYLRIPII